MLTKSERYIKQLEKVDAMQRADVVVRYRLVRTGDNYWELVSNEGLVATCDTLADAVRYCEAQGLSYYIDE